jgi:hypothetical protein
MYVLVVQGSDNKGGSVRSCLGISLSTSQLKHLYIFIHVLIDNFKKIIVENFFLRELSISRYILLYHN